MFKIIEKLKSDINVHRKSVFLHVEGKLGLTCREPVRILSSVFIDLALDMNLPIIPVRFARGLPADRLNSALDFPVGYGKQDYYVGRPVFPEDLRLSSYAERRKTVMNAINQLGPSNEDEEPDKPNTLFAEKVAMWRARTGVSEVKAVLFRAMEGLGSDVCPETRELIRVVHERREKFGDDPMDRWLSGMAAWLLG